MALRLYVSIDLPFSSFLLDIFYLRPLYMKILFFSPKNGCKDSCVIPKGLHDN